MPRLLERDLYFGACFSPGGWPNDCAGRTEKTMQRPQWRQIHKPTELASSGGPATTDTRFHKNYIKSDLLPARVETPSAFAPVSCYQIFYSRAALD